METQLEEWQKGAEPGAVYGDPIPGLTAPIAEKATSDAALLYPHVMKMVSRLISRQGMDRSATDRMDASILLEKFITANTSLLTSADFMASLARDLDLAEGVDEAEALMGLSKLRGRKEELRQISWRSFVLIFPSLRASGFNNLTAISEVLEI